MAKVKVLYSCNGCNLCKSSSGCLYTNPEFGLCSHTKIPEFFKNPEYAEAMQIVLNNFDIEIVDSETVVFSEKTS